MFLKQSNSRDSGRACLNTGFCIFQRDSPQCQYWNFFLTRILQSLQTCGPVALLFEDRSENDEVRTFPCGARNLSSRVTGFANRHKGGSAALRPDFFYFEWGNVIGPQMHAASAAGNGNVSTGVDQEVSSWFLVLGSHLLNGGAGDDFKVASREVFFAQLDIVHAAAGSFGNRSK